MHHDCPDYYRMTPTTDLNRWAAARLNTANWYHHEYAILLNILWGQCLRYVIRLPFKGISEPDMVRDIDKAITQLQDLRVVLAPPEIIQSPESRGTCSWDTLTPHQQAHLRDYRMGEESWYCWQMPSGDSAIFSISDSDTWALVRKHKATARLIVIPEEGT